MQRFDKPSIYLSRDFSADLSVQTLTEIDKYANIVTLPAGHVVLHEGDTSRHLYFILQGVVRGFYIDKDGNDITKCFASEKQFFSTEGLRTGAASSFSIECIESCVCVQISYQVLQRCFLHDHEFFKIVNRFYQDEVKRLENREKNLLMMSAKENYQDFCNNNPSLSERLPLKYIASYIGIRAASLSRIRR